MSKSNQHQTHRIEVPPSMAEQISKYAKRQRISRNQATADIIAAGLDALEAWQVGDGPKRLYQVESTSRKLNSSGELEMGTDWHFEFDLETLGEARVFLLRNSVGESDFGVMAKEVGPRVKAIALREPVLVGDRYWRIVKRAEAPNK